MSKVLLRLLVAGILTLAAACAQGANPVEQTDFSAISVPTAESMAMPSPTPTLTLEPTATSEPTVEPTLVPEPKPTPVVVDEPKLVDYSLCQPADSKEETIFYISPSIGVKRRIFPEQNSQYTGAAVQNTEVVAECKRTTEDGVWYRVRDAKGSFWTREEWLSIQPIYLSNFIPYSPEPSPKIESSPKTGNGVVLTFDDGPYYPWMVHEILDILKSKGVKAIFFLNCQAKSTPDVVKRIIAEGHLLANHTCNHRDLTTFSYQEIREEILSNEIPGMAKILRPPYGKHNSFTDAVIAELGYSIKLWDIDRNDWRGLDAQVIVDTVKTNLHPGAVVLMHLHAHHTIEALPAVIDLILNAGYTIGD